MPFHVTLATFIATGPRDAEPARYAADEPDLAWPNRAAAHPAGALPVAPAPGPAAETRVRGVSATPSRRARVRQAAR